MLIGGKQETGRKPCYRVLKSDQKKHKKKNAVMILTVFL